MNRLLERYLQWILRRAAWICAVILFAAVAAGAWLHLARPLSLDTDFTTLLPDDLPAVVESRRISKLVGSTDYLIVAIESPVPEDNIAFADEIAARLENLSELEVVSIEEDKSFFRRNRLLYVDADDLNTILERARARYRFEKKIRNPLYVSLDDEQPPEVSADDIIDKYVARLRERGARGIMKDRDDEDSGGVDLGDRFANTDGTVISVLARPSNPATDMVFGRKLVEKVQKLIDETNPHRNPKMRAEVAGSYRNRYLEYNYIIDDIFTSLGLALVLILLITVAYFRRLRAVGLVFIPLIVGIVFTVAATALTLGRLNMTTALIFAVILGLGIDFGVHMTMRYLDERSRGKSLAESLALAVQKTGRAIVTAGLTTAGGLAVLMLADFKGFTEFGIIATMGIVICLLVYNLLLPSLAVVWERVAEPKPWRQQKDHGKVVLQPFERFPAYLKVTLVVLALLTAYGVYSIPRLQFEYDFNNLRGKSVSTTIKYGATLGQGNSPVVAVLPTPEDARTFTRHLETIIDGDHERTNLLKRAFSLFSFIPEDQERKLTILAELRTYIDKALDFSDLDAKARQELLDIRGWTEAKPITREDLPDWVAEKFREKDGTVGRMVYLYPRADEWIVTEMEAFYDAYGIIELDGKPPVRPTASGFISVEVVRAVQRDGWLMSIASTLVVFLILLADQRSLRRTLFVFSPLLVGLLWTAGAMHLFDIKIGLYNMLVLPTLLGIGIDASVHLYHAYREFGRGGLRHVLGTTGGAIIVAAATTGVGFVGMTIVSHQGLRSIGILAVIGILSCLVGALVTLPTLLALRESRAPEKNLEVSVNC